MASSYALPQDNKHTHHEGQTHNHASSREELDGLGINGIVSNGHPRVTTSNAEQHNCADHGHKHNRMPLKSRTISGEAVMTSQLRDRSGHDQDTEELKGATRHTKDKSSLRTEMVTAFLLMSSGCLIDFATPSYRNMMPGEQHLSNSGDLKHLQESVLKAESLRATNMAAQSSGFVIVLAVAATAILLSGFLDMVRSPTKTTPVSGCSSPRMPMTRSIGQSAHSTHIPTGRALFARVLELALSVTAPLVASIVLGSWRANVILLTLHATGLLKSFGLKKHNQLDKASYAILGALFVAMVTDLAGLTAHSGLTGTIAGYAFVAVAATRPMSATAIPWSTTTQVLNMGRTMPHANILAAAALLTAAIATAVLTGVPLQFSTMQVSAGAAAALVTALALRFAKIKALQSDTKVGYLSSMLTLLLIGILTIDADTWVTTIGNSLLTSFHIGAVMASVAHRQRTANTISDRAVQRSADHVSGLTSFLLQHNAPGSLVHSILQEKDSRRIAYFTCLNFGFMLVQGLYGYLSGSLGLLSDTVHMFFDCLGLIVGLGAAIASKWPPSRDRPFGWGKLNTLAGFGNGVFLMLVSVEFVWEAIEGILEGRELRRVKELFVVSTLGLLVNIVGLFAFGHAHAGHDHGHDHHHHDGHGHDHNENMHGIFLHVAADAGGSLAVILSTALTIWNPWYLWDPLATIIIAILIFAAAVPLVVASGQKLLLIVPEDIEYTIKNFLQEVGEIRGVLAYSEPRFWTVDERDAHAGHQHDEHSEHAHSHGQNYEPSQQHKHDHEHHDHKYEHDHDATSHKHSHDHRHGHGHHHDHHHDHSIHAQAHYITGSLIVSIVQHASLEDVRERVQELAIAKGVQLTIQVQYVDQGLGEQL